MLIDSRAASKKTAILTIVKDSGKRSSHNQFSLLPQPIPAASTKEKNDTALAAF
jgi:hypothetical protein